MCYAEFQISQNTKHVNFFEPKEKRTDSHNRKKLLNSAYQPTKSEQSDCNYSATVCKIQLTKLKICTENTWCLQFAASIFKLNFNENC